MATGTQSPASKGQDLGLGRRGWCRAPCPHPLPAGAQGLVQQATLQPGTARPALREVPSRGQVPLNRTPRRRMGGGAGPVAPRDHRPREQSRPWVSEGGQACLPGSSEGWPLRGRDTSV